MNPSKTLLPVIGMIFLLSCGNRKKAPDVSAVNIATTTVRFEKDFFSVDTSRLDASLQALHSKHPGFTQDFLFNILGTAPDSAAKVVPFFLRSYRGLYEASLDIFKDFSATEQEIKTGLQYVRHYFPGYKIPGKLITFIGPIDSYGNIITPDALAVGLQLYLGKDYPLYLSEQGQQLYPLYISRKFERAYIPVNCMKNIIDDMYPNNSIGRPLIEQMVESGKRLYLLNQLLPETADTLLTGYTEQELETCYRNEKNIWSFFVQNNILYNGDPNMTRDYLTEAPGTPAISKDAPGNIGQFVGSRIVEKWMAKNGNITPKLLMETPAGKIFEDAKYRP